jgi:hypothetical protein
LNTLSEHAEAEQTVEMLAEQDLKLHWHAIGGGDSRALALFGFCHLNSIA